MCRLPLLLLLVALSCCAVAPAASGAAVTPSSCKGAKAKTKRCRCPKPKVRDRRSGKCVRAKKPAKKPATPKPDPAQPGGAADRDDAGMAAALANVALSRPPITYNFLPGGTFALCDGATAWAGTWQVVEGYRDPATPGAYGGRVQMERATADGTATIEAALVLQKPTSQLTTGGFAAFPDGDFATVAGGAKQTC